MAATWHLYVLECVDGSLYTGITTDVSRRFAAHVAGKGARYTRAHPPIGVLAVFPFPDRSSASIAECRVKRLSAASKRELCREQSTAGPNVPAPAARESERQPDA